MIIPWGSIVNALAIIAGGLVGVLFGARLPERIRRIVFQGFGMCIMLLGIQMALEVHNPLIMIFSILLGGVLGAGVCLEERLLGGAEVLKRRLKSRNPQFSEGMVSAAVLFCIGAMAILGPFDEGLRDDRSILYTKSTLDCFIAMAMAAALGGGVIFSAFFVLLYQGALTLFAAGLQDVLSPAVMTELTATGGLLIIGVGINLLELTRIPLSNLLPALLFVPLLASLFL